MHYDLDFSKAAELVAPDQKPAPRAPWHLYAIGLSSLVWNLLGVFGFLATLTRFAPYKDKFPEGAREYWATLPGWIFAIWGLAVFTALAGAAMLLRRQALAVRTLAVSASATVISMAASYSRPAPDGGADTISAVCVIVVSLLLLNYALHQSRRGILR